MKVVHLSLSDSGGAGLAALRINKALRSIGVDSRMLVADKSSKDDSVVQIKEKTINTYIVPQNKVLKRVKKFLRNRGHFLTEIEKDAAVINTIPSQKRTFFTSPISCYDLRFHPVIEEADIIHLHWVEGFVDYRTFFPYISNVGKPIVWTYHDENIGFGGFHYQRERDRYYEYYKDIEDKYCSIKQEALSAPNNITMVSLSKEMDAFCHKKSFVSQRQSVIVPNAVDYNRYVILDKAFAKQTLKISPDKTVLSFCAYEMSEPRKGLAELLDALERLNIPNLVLLCIGGGNMPRKTSVEVYRAGYVTNEDFLSLMYSASDVFVMPSFQEAFAQTPMEALSCGVPVVAFPVSGTDALLNEKNGVRCADFTVESLMSSLKKVLNTKYDSQSIRDDVIERFAPEVIAQKYKDVYDEVINSHSKQK